MSTTAFVEQLYQRFLNRPADPAGLDFWVKKMTAAR